MLNGHSDDSGIQMPVYPLFIYRIFNWQESGVICTTSTFTFQQHGKDSSMQGILFRSYTDVPEKNAPSISVGQMPPGIWQIPVAPEFTDTLQSCDFQNK